MGQAAEEQARPEALVARVDLLPGSVSELSDSVIQLIAEVRGMKMKIMELEEVSQPKTALDYRVSYYNPRLISN